MDPLIAESNVADVSGPMKEVGQKRYNWDEMRALTVKNALTKPRAHSHKETFGAARLFPDLSDKAYPAYITNRSHPKGKGKVVFVDLFSGIGGFHIGLEHAAASLKLGTELRFASDINEPARDVYGNYFKQRPEGDVTEIDPSAAKGVDLICGGFPCQPFSNSGLKRGLSDKRGTLFYQIQKFVKHCSPRAFILENVYGLLNNGTGEKMPSKLHAPGHRRLIGSTMQHLEAELLAWKDYQIQWACMDSSHFGSPQVRHRVFIVGIHKDYSKGSGFSFPKGSDHRNTLRTILENGIRPELDLNPRQKANILSDMKRAGRPSYRFGMRRVGKAYHCKGGNVGQAYHIDGLAPTLTTVWAHFLPIYLPGPREALPRDIWHDDFEPGPSYGKGTLRRASVRECFRLQGFPDDFAPDQGANHTYHQIGNAVNCTVVAEVAKAALKACY